MCATIADKRTIVLTSCSVRVDQPLIPERMPQDRGAAQADRQTWIMVQNRPFARKLAAFVSLSTTDLAAVAELYRRCGKFAVGHDMFSQGAANQAAYILADGWASSYKILANGSRQIVNIRIPGDFLGLRSALFRTAGHAVEPITPVEASKIPSNFLQETFAKAPRLATAVLWASSRGEAMVVEHLVGIGRRNASEGVGHFMLELSARLRLVGLGDTTGFDCPLSQ